MMRLISSSRATSAACRPAAPPKAQQRKLPGIDAAAQGHQADAVGHLQIDHAVDAGGGLQPRQPKRRGDAVDGGFRRGAVERALATHEGGRIEIAEHDIGVGDGRGRAAIAVAGRTRHRARAFRADPQGAAGIDARDRAAAGRDARDVEAAQRDALAGQHAVGRQRRLSVRDQRNVGRGAAHVERHEVGNAEQIGAAPAAGNAAGRPRQHGAGGQPRGLLHRRHAAMRQHDEQAAR